RLERLDATFTDWQRFTVTVPAPTLTVRDDLTAAAGQSIAISTLTTIADAGGVVSELHLWDATAGNGQIVINGVAQTSGHEIDIATSAIGSTVFTPGATPGSDLLWAQLKLNDGTLTPWQSFTV